jgi:acyl-CoA synthetase (AMP-forming)/AMP-acid ligase II
MIITGGENVYPREVESVLAEHPDITEVAVVGIPDERWGQVVTAVLVGDTLPETAALEAWLRERLAGYKVPRRWLLADELPRNATGKVLKHQLRSQYADAGSRAKA